MFRRSLSWFVLVVTLLEFVVRTQLTAYDNNHGFMANNHNRLLVEEISSIQEELASNIRYGKPHRLHRTLFTDSIYYRSAPIHKFNLKLQIKFEPEFLDFKQRPLGVPHLEKVTLFNTDRNQTIDMTSISGNTVHFHSSFFEDKKIPPLGNTSFNVVFLGREEGAVESNLCIHTTEGRFNYHVKGASIYSPYRLRPIVGIKLPINATFTPLIYIHNPFLQPIQIVEIYSSGGDFHLELPTGELEGPKDMWEIPALETKAVIKVRFFAKTEQNHTAYIRIKLNNTDDILVVPLEVEVTSNAVLYARQGYVDFGVGGSLDPAKEVKLKLSNPFKKSVKIHSITSTSKAIKIEYDNVKEAGGKEVATLKLNWKTAFENKDYSGKIIIKYKNSKTKTEIPYFVTVIEGGLTYNTSTTSYFISDRAEKYSNRKMVVKNDFLTPIMLINITLPEKAQKFFHISDFTPIVLKQKEERAVFTLKLNPGVTLSDVKIDTHIQLNTNISSFEFPLVTYNGKIKLKLPYKSKDNSLDLGLVSLESRKDTYILLVNKNPVLVNIKQLLTSLPSSSVEIVGCGKGKYEHVLLQESYKNMTKCNHIKPGEYAVLRLTVKSGRSEAQMWGDVSIHTQFEQLSIPVHFKAAHGKLEIGPDRLVFDQCFPGKICSHPLRVHSTFGEPMVIENILSVPPDVRITSRHSGHIMARATKIIGHLYLDPNLDCVSECYLGLFDENKANWWKTLILHKSTTEFDLNLVNTLYNRYLNQTSNGLTRWQNLTMRLDTSEVKGHIFKTRVKMSWPSLLADQSFENKSMYSFPLTQVGNTTYRNITIKNPSSHDLLVQIVMDHFYPGFEVLFEGLPPAFIPHNVEPLRKPKHGFFLDKSLIVFDKFSDVHGDTLPVRLEPNDNFTFTIGFKAWDSTTNSAFVFLRNNLTVLEVIHLNGKGAFPSFKFGNRKPGSTQPLAFELTDKHLKDCEWDRAKKYVSPTLTVKRSFTARNTGDVPVYITGFFINSIPCEGYGFKVLNCEPVTLAPNGTKKIDIAFTPDFTLAKITRTLILETSLNYPVNYTLVTTVPSVYLSMCSSVIARPGWENHLYYLAVVLMVILLVFVVVAPILESERIIKEALVVIPRQNNTQHALDLKLIGAQTRTEIHSPRNEPESTPPHKKIVQEPPVVKQQQQQQEEVKLVKQEVEKYTAVVPTTGKGRKNKKKNNNSELVDSESRKKNWLEAQKLKQEESKQQQSVQEPEPVVKKNTKRNNKKNDVKPVPEVQVYEEETSSTTTESSNTEEVVVDKSSLKITVKNSNQMNSLKVTENKPINNNHTEHNKLERRRSNGKNNKSKENKVPERNENYKNHSESKPKNNKRDRKDKQNGNKKVSVSEKVNNKSADIHSNNVSPSLRTSPIITSNIWTENKASFSDVVARSDSTPAHITKPVTQLAPAKPIMYVEPYAQNTPELGPIGSRKLDMWQDNTPRTHAVTGGDDHHTFFQDVHNLAVESSNAFLDIGPTDAWAQSADSPSPLLSLLHGNGNCAQNNPTPPPPQNPWGTPQPQTSSPWNSIPSYSTINNDDTPSQTVNTSSGYLWGSSSVWQPWTPAETPRSPPPGFPPHVDNDEEIRRRQNQQNYNPFGLNSIWTQYQPNPWNYPQGQ